MRRWLARWGFWVTIGLAALAIAGAYALAQTDKHAKGTAAIIAGAGALVIFAALIWLGRRK